MEQELFKEFMLIANKYDNSFLGTSVTPDVMIDRLERMGDFLKIEHDNINALGTRYVDLGMQFEEVQSNILVWTKKYFMVGDSF